MQKKNQNISSDIDMLICLKEMDDEKIKKFREWYFKFHYMYGKIPDFYYPGEIVTTEQLDTILSNNSNIEFKIYNDSDVFDALFYTQIFTDKKIEIFGNNYDLLKYEMEFKKYVPNFCNQIYELLNKNNMIKSERDNMKCLFALSCNDLLFFGKRLNFIIPEYKYTDIVKKIDDGFLSKCLKKEKN